jgi:uncharacterized protein (DUF1778 family)
MQVRMVLAMSVNRSVNPSEAVATIDQERNKRPIQIRVSLSMIRRIDYAAARLGLSRSGFITLSVARRVELMEREAL